MERGWCQTVTKVSVSIVIFICYIEQFNVLYYIEHYDNIIIIYVTLLRYYESKYWKTRKYELFEEFTVRGSPIVQCQIVCSWGPPYRCLLQQSCQGPFRRSLETHVSIISGDIQTKTQMAGRHLSKTSAIYKRAKQRIRLNRVRGLGCNLYFSSLGNFTMFMLISKIYKVWFQIT